MKKILELYRRGMPIRATFFLFFGLFSIGMIIISIMNMIIVGIFVGLFFSALNFSWLPDTYLEDKKESKDKTISQENNQTEAVNTYKVEETPSNINTPKIEKKPKAEVEKSTSNTTISYNKAKNTATCEELSDDFVLVKYKKYKCYMSQNTPKNLADMPKKDTAGAFITSGAKAKIFEAFVNFKPITRDGDSRHIIKADHYGMYDVRGYHDCEYFRMLDDSFMKEEVIPYLGEKLNNPIINAEYLKVKVNKRYEERYDDGSIKYYVELADLTDKYIFDDQIEVKEENYDYYEVGKECALVRIGWGMFFDGLNVYVAMKLEDIEKYIKK